MSPPTPKNASSQFQSLYGPAVSLLSINSQCQIIDVQGCLMQYFFNNSKRFRTTRMSFLTGLDKFWHIDKMEYFSPI